MGNICFSLFTQIMIYCRNALARFVVICFYSWYFVCLVELLVYWYTGILVYWYTGIHWYTLVYWYTSIPVYKCLKRFCRKLICVKCTHKLSSQSSSNFLFLFWKVWNRFLSIPNCRICRESCQQKQEKFSLMDFSLKP